MSTVGRAMPVGRLAAEAVAAAPALPPPPPCCPCSSPVGASSPAGGAAAGGAGWSVLLHSPSPCSSGRSSSAVVVAADALSGLGAPPSRALCALLLDTVRSTNRQLPCSDRPEGEVSAPERVLRCPLPAPPPIIASTPRGCRMKLPASLPADVPNSGGTLPAWAANALREAGTAGASRGCSCCCLLPATSAVAEPLLVLLPPGSAWSCRNKQGDRTGGPVSTGRGRAGRPGGRRARRCWPATDAHKHRERPAWPDRTCRLLTARSLSLEL